MSFKGIQAKIGALAGVAVVALGALVAVGWHSLTNLAAGSREVVEHQFMPLVNEDLKYLVDDLQFSKQKFLEADRYAHEAVIAEKMALVSSNEEEWGQAAATSRETAAAVKTALEAAAPHLTDDQARGLYQDCLEKYEAWLARSGKVVEQAQDPSKLHFARKSSNGGTAQTTFEAMRASLAALQQLQDERITLVLAEIEEKRQAAQNAAADMTQRSAATVRLFSAVGGIAGFVAVAIALFIGRGIARSLLRAIADLAEGAGQVTDASSQISEAAQRLAEGANQQAAALQETSGVLQQMAAMTRTNAESARSASSLTGQARQAAQAGDETTERLNRAMASINESSGQISKVIKVIEEIAFQTNLLALNAAVEAARAGEHGKGFAVVADEVRNLAQRSAEASRETTALIEASVSRAREGGDVAHEVAEALSGIVTDVTKVSELVDGIAQASQEQAQGVEQVANSVQEMDRLTQANAAGSEQCASGAEALAAQAVTVTGVVDDLTAVVRGTRRRPPEQAVPAEQSDASGGPAHRF